jgi:hypothetical protein
MIINTRREHRLTNEYKNFMTKLNEQSLREYFQFDDSIQLHFTKLELDKFELIIDYENKPPFIHQLNLPSDIKLYIKSFLHEKLYLSSSILYPNHYPFHSPKFSLLNVTTNLPYFQSNCIHLFNAMYEYSWSPGIIMEYDILNYILFILKPDNLKTKINSITK